MKNSLFVAALAFVALSSGVAQSAARSSAVVHGQIVALCSDRWNDPADEKACVRDGDAAANYVTAAIAGHDNVRSAVAKQCLESEGDVIEWSVVKICVDNRTSLARKGFM